MAIVAHLVEKLVDPGDQVIDGIAAVLIAINDGVETTSALIQQAAVDEVNVQLGTNKLPDGYFTTNRLVTGTWAADDDITIFDGKQIAENIA